MPPAKKPTAAKPASGANAAPASSRREVQRAISSFEKAIEDANGALQALARSAGKDAKDRYRELTKSLTAVRRDAKRHNAKLIREFDKLKGAVSAPVSKARGTVTRSRSAGTAAAAKPASSTSTNARRTTAAKRASH